MKLQRITLSNFRQFVGAQSFDLKSDDLKPVSLLFGANGSGKTTLLNAFTWVLYGSMSEDVEQQERLVNDGVWRSTAMGDSVTVSVELGFDHEGHDYRVLRSTTAYKDSDRQNVTGGELQVWRTDASGASQMVRAPQEVIYSILPRGVSRFFFFNGERIENLIKKGAYAEVQKDIKVLLDLEQVERAIDHLPRVDRKITSDLKKHGGAGASQIQEAIDSRREQERGLREEAKLVEGEIAVLNEEREAVAALLRKHADAAPVQSALDTVERELDDARGSLETAIASRETLVATRGFQAFTDSLGESTRTIAEGLYQRGALPAPLKREFVDKLLEDGSCICGTVLSENTAAWDHVRDWRQRAGLQAVETAWQRLSGQIAPLASARDELRVALSDVVGRISTERDRVARLEEEQAELKGKLRESPVEDVQALETKRMGLDSRISSKQLRLGAIGSELQNVEREIEQKTRERSKAEVTDELAAKARSRSDLVHAVLKALTEILAIREEDMRRRLDAKLKAIFGAITHQNHIPTLNAGFELTLHKEVDGVQLPVPKSTGENQILSLSFVTAVSGIAREIRTERRAEGESSKDAGTYPIVMDAAFGSLDEDYQEAVARALAKMAPQLVVLVSKSQGLGTVVDELMPYVSHLGVIESHTTAEGNVDDDIVLRGISYPYIVSANQDRSELKEIK